jgi:hypothetical protein
MVMKKGLLVRSDLITKTLSIVLTVLLGHAFLFAKPVSAHSSVEKQAQFAEKVRVGINNLGTGEDARIEVKLKDKSKVTGYVEEIKESSFVVKDSKTGANTSVAYSDVKQVQGKHLSTGAKIAIGVGIGAGIVSVVVVILLVSAFAA